MSELPGGVSAQLREAFESGQFGDMAKAANKAKAKDLKRKKVRNNRKLKRNQRKAGRRNQR